MKRELTPKQRINRAEWKLVGYGAIFIILAVVVLIIIKQIWQAA